MAPYRLMIGSTFCSSMISSFTRIVTRAATLRCVTTLIPCGTSFGQRSLVGPIDNGAPPQSTPYFGDGKSPVGSTPRRSPRLHGTRRTMAGIRPHYREIQSVRRFSRCLRFPGEIYDSTTSLCLQGGGFCQEKWRAL